MFWNLRLLQHLVCITPGIISLRILFLFYYQLLRVLPT